jgi:hypothetical protein
MKRSCAQVQAVALLGALCFCTALHAQEAAPAVSPPAVTPEDEIVVHGKALENLRVRIERAEDDVYTRFNEINSDDSYDIHCYDRMQKGSHIKKRVCLSNAARAADVGIAQATVFALQGGTTGDGVALAPGGQTGVAQAQYAKQLEVEQRVRTELARLAQEDPALRADVERLGDAYRALDVVAGSRPGETLYAELGADKKLPDAQHLFEVRVGNVAWRHALTSHTFTLANVQGRIRELHVDCGNTVKTLDYKTDAEWTIPESWGTCTLQVDAKRGTTFAFYEFE